VEEGNTAEKLATLFLTHNLAAMYVLVIKIFCISGHIQA
jgi:hypothetical protein